MIWSGAYGHAAVDTYDTLVVALKCPGSNEEERQESCCKVHKKIGSDDQLDLSLRFFSKMIIVILASDFISLLFLFEFILTYFHALCLRSRKSGSLKMAFHLFCFRQISTVDLLVTKEKKLIFP